LSSTQQPGYHWNPPHPRDREVSSEIRKVVKFLVAHTHNPSYSGSRDQEDLSLKVAQANSWRPYLQKTHHKKKKKAGGVAQGGGPVRENLSPKKPSQKKGLVEWH
jgi:hypothetical protein